VMPRRNRNAGQVRELAPGDPHGDLRRLLVSIASKAEGRKSKGRGTASNRAERGLTDPRRRSPALARLP
jgi:hypothetical protein